MKKKENLWRGSESKVIRKSITGTRQEREREVLTANERFMWNV